MSIQKPPKTYSHVNATVVFWKRQDGKDGAAADYGFVRTEHGHKVYLAGRVLWMFDLQITPRPGDTLVLHYREGEPSHLATTVVSYTVACKQSRNLYNKKQKESMPQPVVGRGRVIDFDPEKGVGFLELDQRFGAFAGKVYFNRGAIKASRDERMPEVPLPGDWLQCTINPGKPAPTASNLVALELVNRDSNIIVLNERRKTGIAS